MVIRPQNERGENIVEAARLLINVVKTTGATDVSLHRNVFAYGTGTETFTVTVESQNFMDARREKVEASK